MQAKRMCLRCWRDRQALEEFHTADIETGEIIRLQGVWLCSQCRRTLEEALNFLTHYGIRVRGVAQDSQESS